MSGPKPAKKVEHIKDLVPDPANARRHTPRNIGMIERSFNEVGAGRSVVIDEDNVLLAGNGAIEAAALAGITKVVEIETDGETIVAVRRRGLTPEQKKKLALYDNRTAELAEWDEEAILKVEKAMPEVVAHLWNEDEIEAIRARLENPTLDSLEDEYGAPEDDAMWPKIIVKVPPELLDRWNDLMGRLPGEAPHQKLDVLVDLVNEAGLTDQLGEDE